MSSNNRDSIDVIAMGGQGGATRPSTSSGHSSGADRGSSNNRSASNRGSSGRGRGSSDRASSGSRGSGKKKMTKRQRQLRKRKMLIIEIIALVVLLLALLVWGLISKVDFQKFSLFEAGINEDLDTSFLTGYTNIAVFGLDNRDETSYDSGNSDVIMVASINNETKEIRLVSVYRDTYLCVDDEQNYNKANAAYAHGGAKNAVKMLNRNLDLNITEFVCVDWKALIETIDALGGVEIDVQENEVEYLNAYVGDTTCWVPEADGTWIAGSGLQTLNGTQATAYARIRYTAGDDFMRAARQRIVLQAMMDKVKQADLKTLFKIVNDVADDVSTSFNLSQLLGLASAVKDYSIAGTTGFPFQLTTGYVAGKDYVFPVELDNNVVALHQYLFGEEENYTPSNTMQTISDEIVSISGISESNAELYDLDRWLQLADPEWEQTHQTETNGEE